MRKQRPILKIILKKNLGYVMSEEKAEKIRSLVASLRQSISKANSEKKPLVALGGGGFQTPEGYLVFNFEVFQYFL